MFVVFSGLAIAMLLIATTVSALAVPVLIIWLIIRSFRNQRMEIAEQFRTPGERA